MEFYAEMKLAGDEYAGGFSCGLTMTGSKTIKGFTPISETPEKTQYQNERGIILTVHKKKDGAALRTWSTVHNGSQEEITLEMLASFVLTNVEADKIHRLQSFWSAEGKLRTETIEDLHLEKSWSGAGVRIEKFGNVGSVSYTHLDVYKRQESHPPESSPSAPSPALHNRRFQCTHQLLQD